MASGVGKKLSNVFVWVLLVLLVVGLAGFSVTNFDGNNASIAKVGDREIDVNDYYRSAQQSLRAYQQQTGQSLTIAQPEAQQLLESVRTQLVFNAAVENEADRIGLSVGDPIVARQVRASAAFQGIDGKFDRVTYERALEQNGTSVTDFEDDVRRETARALIQGSVVGEVAMPKTYIDRMVTYLGERRSFKVVRFNRATLGDTPLAEPTDAEVQAYYDANLDEFKLPERKKITYAWVTPEMLLDAVTVEETALAELYEQRSAEFNLPERRLVERLIFPDQEAADTAMARLESTEVTFVDLVSERNLTLDDIDLGEVSADDLGPVAEPVFAIAEPGVVGPLQTNLGPALFRVNAILEAQTLTLDEARPILSVELQLQAARRRIDNAITDIDDLLASGASLEDAANETDLELGSLEYYPGVTDPIASYDDFRSAANALTENDFPEIAALDDGGIFAMRLDETLAPSQQPLDAVRDAAFDAAYEEVQTKRLRDLAETLNAQVAVGATLDSGGDKVETYTDMTRRTAFVPNAAPDLTQGVFDMSVGETRLFDAFGTVFLVQLNKVAPPDASDTELEQLRTSLNEQVNQSLGTDIYQMFARALSTQAGVQFDSQVINAVHAELR